MVKGKPKSMLPEANPNPRPEPALARSPGRAGLALAGLAGPSLAWPA